MNLSSFYKSSYLSLPPSCLLLVLLSLSLLCNFLCTLLEMQLHITISIFGISRSQPNNSQRRHNECRIKCHEVIHQISIEEFKAQHVVHNQEPVEALDRDDE